MYPWLAASLDFEQWADDKSGPGALEVKTSDSFMRRVWEQWPPLHYQVQLQAQMLVCGLQWGSIAVLMGGNKLRHWDFERNERFQEAMIHRTREFWRCVELEMPPAIDGSMATANALAKLFKDEDGTAVVLTEEYAKETDRLEEIRYQQSELKKERDEIENRLLAAIGTATYAILPDGASYSLKTINRKGYMVEPTSYRCLKRMTKSVPATVPVVALSGETVSMPTVVAECEEATEAIEAVDQTFRKHRRLRTYRHQKMILFARNPHCHWCGAKQKLRTTTIEHVVPLAAGGTNDMENLALACKKCNNERGDQLSAPSTN